MTKDEIKQLQKILAKIKTPNDIKQLHDVRVMLDIIDAGNLLSNHLHEFQDEFIESFAMTADEVLSAIPQNKWKSYKFKSKYYQLFDFRFNVTVYYFEKDKNNETIKLSDVEIHKRIAQIKSEVSEYIPGCAVEENPCEKQMDLKFKFNVNNLESLQDKLYHINKTDKCWYIDHNKKTIELNWSLWPTVVTTTAICYESGIYAKQYNGIYPDRGFEPGVVNIDKKNNIITYTCEFFMYRSFYIPRDSEWYSKRRTHEYDMVKNTITLTHSFCMNTNTYLGCTEEHSNNTSRKRGFDIYNQIYIIWVFGKFNIHNMVNEVNKLRQNYIIKRFKTELYKAKEYNALTEHVTTEIKA
jgi:hypothetical protein